MVSTTRYILLTRTKRRPLRHELTPLRQPPEAAKEQSVKEESVFQHSWVTDWLTACAHLCCSVEKCRLFRCHSLCFAASSSSLMWASLCARQSSACRDIVQPPPAASGTHNQSASSHSLSCLCHTLLPYYTELCHTQDIPITDTTQISPPFGVNSASAENHKGEVVSFNAKHASLGCYVVKTASPKPKSDPFLYVFQGKSKTTWKAKKADWGILAWNSLMGSLRATLWVNRIQGSSSRLLDTWAKHGCKGQ